MSRPEVQAAFRDLLDEAVPREKIIRCIVEGLDAVQTRCCQHEGRITETVTVPDYRVRLLYVVLALKLKGLSAPSAGEGAPTTVTLRWAGEQDGERLLEW